MFPGRLYYTVTQGICTDPMTTAQTPAPNSRRRTFEAFTYSTKYVYENPSGAQCVAPTQPSSVVGDTTNSFCIDPTHIAPLLAVLHRSEEQHAAQLCLHRAGLRQQRRAPGLRTVESRRAGAGGIIINAFMASPEWKDSVFFLAYDEGRRTVRPRAAGAWTFQRQYGLHGGRSGGDQHSGYLDHCRQR